VRAMWLMLQQPEARDYVVATGVLHSVRDLVERAFGHAGLEWERHVRIDEALQRGKAELHDLVGDASLARERFDWAPSIDFDQLMRILVESALASLNAAETELLRLD
jgi:GDPmannose 4,6-dehydratase